MQNRIAKLISYIFHPLYIPSLGVLFILNLVFVFSLNFQIKLYLFLLTFSITCMLPMVGIFILKRVGLINSIYLETKEERRFPFIMIIVFNYMCFYFLKDLLEKIYFYSPLINLFFIGLLFTSFVAMLVNFKYKISIHMLGMGGFLGGVIGLSMLIRLNLFVPIIVIVLLSGVVGWSRLKLNAHKQGEVYWGYAVGFIFMLSIYLLQILISVINFSKGT